MAKERCIPIRRRLVEFMASEYPDFLYQGSHSIFYGFTRMNPDGICDHIVLQREFFQGKIGLVLTEAASTYTRNYRTLPWRRVGYETDIGVLITGENSYPAEIGWRHCENRVDALPELFGAIKNDIDTYVLDYFDACHKRIQEDPHLPALYAYIEPILSSLSDAEIKSMQAYDQELNRASSEYYRACREQNIGPTKWCYELIPFHPLLERWLNELKDQFQVESFPFDLKMELVNSMMRLFLDRYGDGE